MPNHIGYKEHSDHVQASLFGSIGGFCLRN